MLVLALAVATPAQNILAIVVDDVDVDKIGTYGEHPGVGPTPTIDALAANGVLFRRPPFSVEERAAYRALDVVLGAHQG